MAERLPHVARVVLTEDTPGLQFLEMDTRTKDGSTHTTKSVRVCFPDTRIAYKQITLPRADVRAHRPLDVHDRAGRRRRRPPSTPW